VIRYLERGDPQHKERRPGSRFSHVSCPSLQQQLDPHVEDTSMLGTLIKLAAYSKAPKTTFAVTHPKKAARLTKMRWDMKHALAPRFAALGAVAVALPLGLMIGRMGRTQRYEVH
jgi:hypothetical protein